MKPEIQQEEKELVRSLNQGELWNRFVKVRRSVLVAIVQDQNLDIERDVSTFSWTGVDAGIHDHTGSLRGESRGISLDLRIEGTSVEDNPEVKIGEDDKWRLTHKNQQHISVDGSFVSQDGMGGRVSFHFEDGSTKAEAYWLSYLDRGYRLEQVVNPAGDVFDASKLRGDRWGEVKIPGTDVSLQRLLE